MASAAIGKQTRTESGGTERVVRFIGMETDANGKKILVAYPAKKSSKENQQTNDNITDEEGRRAPSQEVQQLDDKATHKKGHTGLLDLPAELRDMIFACALTSNEGPAKHHSLYKGEGRATRNIIYLTADIEQAIDLVYVSKQVRKETIRFLCDGHIVCATASAALTFLRAIGREGLLRVEDISINNIVFWRERDEAFRPVEYCAREVSPEYEEISALVAKCTNRKFVSMDFGFASVSSTFARKD